MISKITRYENLLIQDHNNYRQNFLQKEKEALAKQEEVNKIRKGQHYVDNKASFAVSGRTKKADLTDSNMINNFKLGFKSEGW